MTDKDFAFELMIRLNHLVGGGDIPPLPSTSDEARAARRMIWALTPLRATIENAHDLLNHPSIPVGKLDDNGTVLAGWLSIINGLCGPNDTIQMTFGQGRIDFATHHVDADYEGNPADEGEA